jgi:gamma-glutamyltranspeptidase/glutathione hydrolase
VRGLLALAVLLPLAAHAQEVPPEPATGFARKHAIAAERHMVAAAHPLAAEAGREILRAGGSAVDAAIATQLVLGLVEPQSSGLGGGGFLLHYAAETRAVTSYDGRETAPATARPDRFAGMEFLDAVTDPRSVGVPGLVRMLDLAHGKHGKLPWMRLVEPALRLAENGFPVSFRLNEVLASDRFLKSDSAARALYYPDGAPLPEGAILRNRAYADSLRAIGRDGAAALHSGAIAADMSRAALLSASDLAEYRAIERPPVCRPYRIWQVCSMAPPSSGGVAVLQMLGMLEGWDMAALAPDSPVFAHLFAEAGKLAYADRARWLGDPAFTAVPVAGLLDGDYLRRRAARIDPARALAEVPSGEPGTPNTTHLSVVDGDGNAVALTSSIEYLFGAHIMVRGFLLNNQLTDFSFAPEGPNRVEPGKRPRSSMAPTLVLDRDGRLVAALGSPGGSWIIQYVAQALVGLLDWGLDPQIAVDLPHLGSRGGAVELEQGSAAEALQPALEALGHVVRIRDMTSGLHVIVRRDGRLWGGADGRREGAVAGD